MSAVIKTTQATIAQATISIQTLRVDGKSLTLNLFKQLPESKFMSQDGALDETADVWGFVRYAIGPVGIWVIQSKGGTLYRCPVEPPRDYTGTYNEEFTDDCERRYWSRKRDLERITALGNKKDIEVAERLLADAQDTHARRLSYDAFMETINGEGGPPWDLPQLFIGQ